MARRRCFISARYGLDAAVLQRALEANEIDWQWAQDLPTATPLMDAIAAAINSADFVLGVFSEEAINPNVVFEVGYALGKGVPVVLLTTDRATAPFDLATFRQLKTDLNDPKLLTFQLGLLLQSLEPSKKSRRVARSLPASGKVGPERSAQQFAAALEGDVAAAIISAGGRVTLPEKGNRTQAVDLLMWLPEVDKEFFNPAAVEVKHSIRSQELLSLQVRLGEFVQTAGFACGLIVVNTEVPTRELSSVLPFPYIFVISFKDFRERLEKRELGVWIRRERNRLAHGVR